MALVDDPISRALSHEALGQPPELVRLLGRLLGKRLLGRVLSRALGQRLGRRPEVAALRTGNATTTEVPASALGGKRNPKARPPTCREGLGLGLRLRLRRRRRRRA
eukprot:scaffold81132_cov45-Phaeocystis_antarctica.AAC.1